MLMAVFSVNRASRIHFWRSRSYSMETHYLVVIAALLVELVYCIKPLSCHDLNMLTSSFASR